MHGNEAEGHVEAEAEESGEEQDGDLVTYDSDSFELEDSFNNSGPSDDYDMP